MIDRVQLKLDARGIIKNARVSAYLFTLLYLAISAVFEGVNAWLSGSQLEDVQYTLSLFGYGPQWTLHYNVPDVSPAVVTLSGVVVFLVSVILGAGVACYHLGIRRGETMGYATLFDGFTFAGKLILLNIVVGLFVFLWTLLLIVPGIIAAYRYRFALYNLCENPDMGILEAINMSKIQTDGYKWQLFVLDLSFIGWSILCGLTLGILSIWVSPYVAQTNVGYFQTIKAAKGVGYMPGGNSGSSDDGQFRPDDRFSGDSFTGGQNDQTPPHPYDPER